MQHGHGYAAMMWTCSMDMGIQHGHGHPAWTESCSMDRGMQHCLGHAAWTWTWNTCGYRLLLDQKRQRTTLAFESFVEELAELSES
jgi:hypothetical protein